uniref:Protein-PII uridylyltransferase N-terminal domain-containing protein n=1 Tax=Branchiostoma floridae TaxID=7739 RepID=C3ZG15_BRAFL|eukprot:XP_002592479.1 hypothetical protein BRAFLDRAFT_68965 [Branchiostoma floridae]
MATKAEIAIPQSAEDIAPFWVQSVLQKDLTGITVTDVDVKGSINQGEGFMSDIIAFDAVGIRNGTSQRYSLVAKLTDFKRPFTILKECPKDFHIKLELTEVKFYSEAVPELLSVAIPGTERESKPGKEDHPPTDSLFLPKCYFAATDPNSMVSVRVMENLKSQGFSIKPNRQPLSRAEMMLAAGALAQLHGLSHLLELRSGKPLPEKYDWILSRSDIEGMRGTLSYQYQTAVKEFATAFPDQADLTARLEKLDPYREILKLAEGPRLKVICHVGSWVNNIMIKQANVIFVPTDPNKPDRCKEAECLCRLGDVRRGKRTRKGKKFTQAAALYNTAMARTDKIKDSVTKRLQEMEQWLLLYTANVNSTSIPSDQAVRHKKRLEDSSSRAKSQLEVIDQQYNPYQCKQEDPKMTTVEAERAEAIKALFKSIAKDRQSFIQDLVDECVGTLGPPPCKYAFIGLGSQATELVTPYSDLEFAILIEEGKDNDATRRYFINLTHYLHLKVINLGETILPAMAIPSLNDFQSEEPVKDWFFDYVTPRGFAFDGFMPWASKTPFGRDKTKRKPSVSLIQTPANMATFQHLDIAVSEGYHLSDILRRPVFLAGDEALASKYVEKLLDVITDDRLSRFQSRLSCLEIISENRGQLSKYEPTGQLLNVKKDIYRFPSLAIELLALRCRIALSSAWDVIERLKEMENIEEENAKHLKVLTSISAELRLRTYMANGGQRDSLSPLAEMKAQEETQDVSDSILRSVFYIPDTKVLLRYYCRAIPLKRCIAAMLQDPVHYKSSRVLKTSIFDTSNECLGFIAKTLLLSNISLRHLEAALTDAGSDAIKRAELFDGIGHHWLGHGDISKAKFYFAQSLKLRQSIYGETLPHFDIAKSFANLGVSWSSFGDQSKAISYYKRSLEIMKTIYGDSAAHPNIVKVLTSIGSSWMILGDQKKAISYFEKSLTMTKTIYGDNTAHRDIASLFQTLGSSWRDLGDHVKTISYHQQSLTMLKTIYGDNTAHPEIAYLLQILGESWMKLGDYRKTVSYIEQSLTMMTTIYGDKKAHPNIAPALHSLGSCMIKLGDFKKAIVYLEQSLTVKKTIYGHNTTHPAIAATLVNLGLCWSELGDHMKAISYYEQSLVMLKTVYGDSKAHSEITMMLLNLGLSWNKLVDHTKSISYFEQSLKMAKTIY